MVPLSTRATGTGGGKDTGHHPMPSEADTCRKYVVPRLQTAGWENDPHSIAEQRFFTAGRIVVHGTRAIRRAGKRADYLLRYTRDFPIAAQTNSPTP